MKLVDKYLNTNRHIYADNFFSSLDLVEKLFGEKHILLWYYSSEQERPSKEGYESEIEKGGQKANGQQEQCDRVQMEGQAGCSNDFKCMWRRRHTEIGKPEERQAKKSSMYQPW